VSGRSTVNHEGPILYAGTFEDQSDHTDIYLGPTGEKPGIFAYGPFSIYSYPPTTFNYHIYIHPSSDYDVLEHFAYGGPEFLYGNEVILHTLPISPSVIDSSVNMLLEYTTLTHQIEAYLRGDPQYKDGVQIPDDLLVNPIHIPTNVLDHVYFRFPLVETLLSTLAARLSHSRLSHPYGRYTLRDLKQLVNPLFPVLRNPSNALVKDLQTPELPFIQARFLPCESTHPEDTAADLPVPYFGCLRRYEAFLFQKKFPTYAPQLFHEAMATVHLVALHADPKTRPPPANGGVIDWKQVLEPYNFADFFPLDTPSHLLLRACPNSSTNNFWFPRVQYILQCARQINQLIRVFETFFLTIGYKGLRDLADEIWLNKEVDFLYSPILSYDQAVYFTTLYDFLLREHAGFLARPILQLLHITFPHTEHLDYVFEHIVDMVERPLYLYQLNREDDMNPLQVQLEPIFPEGLSTLHIKLFRITLIKSQFSRLCLTSSRISLVSFSFSPFYACPFRFLQSVLFILYFFPCFIVLVVQFSQPFYAFPSLCLSFIFVFLVWFPFCLDSYAYLFSCFPFHYADPSLSF
jgi:hypothetical protein